MLTLIESKSTRRGLWLARMRAILMGVLAFVPAFFLSLVVTVPWAKHHWAGEAQGVLGAIGPSFWIGVAAVVLCCFYLLRKANKEHTPDV